MLCLHFLGLIHLNGNPLRDSELGNIAQKTRFRLRFFPYEWIGSCDRARARMCIFLKIKLMCR